MTRSQKIFSACAISIALLALTWAVFGQTLRHDFVNYDDDFYVYENADIISGVSAPAVLWAFTHFHAANWHPLTTISHMLDCTWFGLHPGGHHFVNVLLHSLTAVLLFLVLWNMTRAIWRSAFVAMIFAIHPLHVESVAWIAERKDVLSGLFFVLTLAAYVRYARTPSIPRYLLVALLFALGLLSKTMLVTVPAILLLVDFWPLRRFQSVSASRLILEKLPLLLLAAGSALATLLAQQNALGSRTEFPISVRATNALVSYLTYLWQTFWPLRLAAFYPHVADEFALWKIAVATAVLIGLTLLAIIFRNRYPYLLTGWFWYLIMLLPVLGIIQVGLQAHADRYAYLSQIGLCLLVTWTVSDLFGGRATAKTFLAVGSFTIVGALAWLASIQASFWRNSETLWTHALAVTRDNAMAHLGLGDLYFVRGKTDEAIAEFRTALKIQPTSPYVHANLGAALVGSGAFDEAIEHLETTIRLKPQHPRAHFNLGNAFLHKGRFDEAAAQYQEQLGIQPDHPGAHCNLATALMRKGELDHAIAEFEKTIAMWPDYTEAHYNLATCYAQKGDIDRAIDHYQTALKLGSASPKAYNNLAVVLVQKGKLDDAIAQWQQACTSIPTILMC